jgi:2-C-methyl-D-erythritol 4-phosphate cytidylyltransferase
MPKFAAIVVAAGSGQRFGDKENKIFAILDGQPLFLRALQLFVNREDICQTILVVSPEDMDTLREKFGANLGFMGVQVVSGGTERTDSVEKGLTAVSLDAEFVAIHDAVRVCVAEGWIDAVFDAAAKSGAAIPVVPVTATLKRLGPDKTVSDTVSREGLYMAQTPQVFRKTVIRAAYDQRGTIQGPVTDDAQLVSASGHPVTAIEGDPRNIKITTKADLALASAILKALPAKPVSRRGAFEEAQW